MRLALPACTGALLLAALATSPPARAQEGAWALTNARIETVTKGVIERGTIVVRDGLIAAVGSDVSPPADARVLDLTGRTVYPGLIDLISSLGIAAPAPPPTGGRAAAQAAAPAEGTPVGLEPERMVADEFRPQAGDVKSLRDAGITAVLTAPTRGAFRGLSALVPLRDSLTARHTIRSPVALSLGFEGTQGFRYPATLLGVIAYERQAFYDAKRQGLLLDRYRANPRGMGRPPYDARLAALVPVVRGELPAFFAAKNENEIRRAVGIGREFGLKLTVVGATEGFRATDALKAMGQPVVVSVDFPKASDVTGWQYRWTERHAPGDSAAADSAARPVIEGNAAALSRAGIPFALASGGVLRPAEFLANVRKAIAAGLPRDVALQALTIRPAEIAGVADQLGSIEPGKIANLVVTEGDLLGDSAKVRDVFVDGARYEVVAPAPAARGGGGRGAGAGAEAAADIGGAWDVTVTTPQGGNEATMTVTQSGASFSGQMVSQMGTAPVENGQVAGRSVSWTITLSMGGQSMTITFHGEVEGNRIRGTVDLPGMGAASFTAQKRPS
jgi:imidazolonepropionase-like amidohydrolase